MNIIYFFNLIFSIFYTEFNYCNIYENINSVVAIMGVYNDTYEIVGTGFFINSDGDIITNYHVIENLDNIFIGIIDDIKYPPLNKFAAITTFNSKQDDISILKIFAENKKAKMIFSDSIHKSLNYINKDNKSFDLEIKPFKINKDEIYLGEDIFILGFPDAGFSTITVTKGIISGFLVNKFIKSDAEINPGNSGGPVINKNLEIIGIASSLKLGYIDDEIIGKIGLIIPIKDSFYNFNSH